MGRMRHALIAAAGLGVLLTGPADAMAIHAIFAASYAGANPGLGPIQSLAGNKPAQDAIDAAAQQIGSLLSATHGTVNILFYDAPQSGFLGATYAGQAPYTYADYVQALALDAAAHPFNSPLASAVAHLGMGNGAADPSHTFVVPTTANARALGLGAAAPNGKGVIDASPQYNLSGAMVGSGGRADAVVFLNTGLPTCYTHPVQGFSQGFCIDFQSTAAHEIDEVLGIGGGSSTLNNLLANPAFAQSDYGLAGTVLGTTDLYRFSAPGVASYAVDSNPADPNQPDTAYFSVDGGITRTAWFNQQYMVYGDAGDWSFTGRLCPGGFSEGGAGYVQDAFGCNNEQRNIGYGSPEAVALQAVGYDMPEPAPLLLFAGGLALVACGRRFAVDGSRRRYVPTGVNGRGSALNA